MRTIIKNIKELVQIRDNHIDRIIGKDMKVLPTIKNAYLIIKNDIITDFGLMKDLNHLDFDKEIDATGKLVLPSWCDSHTHIVYAGNRESEFVDRINGLTYEEIALKGGGILNSAKNLQDTSEDELFVQASVRIEEIIQSGTGAVEIKSGYGLEIGAEIKMLRVINRLAHKFPIAFKSTFLGAHAFPESFKNKKEEYVKKICEEMIPQIVQHDLAEFIDVFCEKNYFTVEQMETILETGKKYGLIPKIHVNQFNSIGGVESGVKHNALSVDHLEIMTAEDIAVLKDSKTMPVALPACSFFLGIPYTPARKMIDQGLPLALATDFNPGSSPTGNMHFVVASACIKMNMTPEEAINAATMNGAYAMNLSHSHGSISIGKKANLIITKPIPSYHFIPYAFGSNLIDQIILNGNVY
ncbi:imidazolonepropionase [Namhaeicola litoreus]|uniref:Imidazolonepropionase n=1 Tax=Namhaeicola litoreus TaxID=1052145 RepID=A0ABW3Y2G4_9FLAO